MDLLAKNAGSFDHHRKKMVELRMVCLALTLFLVYPATAEVHKKLLLRSRPCNQIDGFLGNRDDLQFVFAF